MKQKNKEYDKLHKLSLQAKILHGISGLLHWDQETHMPPGASSIRGMQLETLAGLIHEAKTNDEFAKALFSLIDRETGAVKANHLSEEQHAALREWRRDYLKEIALPKKFVEEFAKLTSESILAWRDAKKKQFIFDFLSLFR